MLFFEIITLMPRWVRTWLFYLISVAITLYLLSAPEKLVKKIFLIEVGLIALLSLRKLLSVVGDYASKKWCKLGLRYAEQAKGDARDSHAVKAAKYFIMRGSLGYGGDDYDDVMVNLGLCYACGFGVEKNPRKAAKCYRHVAKDSTIAQLALGLCYADGIGVETDRVKAEDLLSKAKAPSVYELERFWNKKEVLTWLRVAGERGNTGVQMALGEYYQNENNHAEAVKWFRKATEAAHDYSVLYDFPFWGRGKRFDAVCDALWKLSYKVASYTHLARIYLGGGNGVENDAVEAVQCLKKVAESELVDFVLSNPKRYSLHLMSIYYVQAQLDLGACYAKGEGVVKNEAEAVKWFRKAAEQGNADAQTFLADCYLFGRGVAKDEAEALTWFRRAAKQDGYGAERAKSYLKAVEDGDPEAQCDLASAYLTGWHRAGWQWEENEAEAIKWYRKAAEQGHEKAKQLLNEISK